jgi:hypothetical protein
MLTAGNYTLADGTGARVEAAPAECYYCEVCDSDEFAIWEVTYSPEDGWTCLCGLHGDRWEAERGAVPADD